MKTGIPKKLMLKKVTISIHKIYGGDDVSQNDTTDTTTTELPTLSSAFHDPTESQIDPKFLSFNAGICA
ncbi:hypothetical protein [Kordia jejudonensis]|uniref:hypothetical protein n=1 Tax=Kordia jejudonensis TaxID=1348245 RepID=UPI000629C7F8|nr:hypothetical protein [Kordia jejudonensis]